MVWCLHYIYVDMFIINVPPTLKRSMYDYKLYVSLLIFVYSLMDSDERASLQKKMVKPNTINENTNNTFVYISWNSFDLTHNACYIMWSKNMKWNQWMFPCNVCLSSTWGGWAGSSQNCGCRTFVLNEPRHLLWRVVTPSDLPFWALVKFGPQIFVVLEHLVFWHRIYSLLCVVIAWIPHLTLSCVIAICGNLFKFTAKRTSTGGTIGRPANPFQLFVGNWAVWNVIWWFTHSLICIQFQICALLVLCGPLNFVTIRESTD